MTGVPSADIPSQILPSQSRTSGVSVIQKILPEGFDRRNKVHVPVDVEGFISRKQAPGRASAASESIASISD